MPEYLAPGVYVEEVSTGPVPIEGVSTSTTGFVGPTPRGPLHPQLVTSWLEFQLWYGGLTELDGSSAFATWAGDGFAYTVWAAKGFFDNGGQRLFMARVVGKVLKPPAPGPGPAPAGPPPPSVAALDLAPKTAGQATLTIASVGEADLTNQLFVRVTDPTQRDPADPTKPDPTRTRISIVFYDFAPPTPLVDPLSLASADLRNTSRRDPTIVEDYDNLQASDIQVALGGSTLVTANFSAGLPALPANKAFTALAPGSYGNPLAEDHYIGDGGVPLDQRSGLAALATLDEVSLLCVPNEVSFTDGNITGELRIQCELLKDRFAILQVLEGQANVANILPPLSSSYAATYYPWIRVVDPISQATMLVPPGGHVAGIYAATDEARGVHKAPANVEVAGILLNDLPGNIKPLEYAISKGDQEILNPIGINVIRDFRASGLGCRVWGARTLSSDAQWKYVNVRRLFIFVEQSVIRGTQWVVFEPNDEITWARVRRSLSDFLTSVWKSGALVGATPDEAFFVRCDNTTMTQDDIDNGRLICLVGMAPAKPAEFVIFRFSQSTGQPTS
jgi:phage tail sheath protein FI